MKRLTLLFTFLISGLFIHAQNYSKAKVYADSEDLLQLANAGVPVDHGSFKKDTWIISDFSDRELAIIDSLGVQYDILVYDVVEYYQRGLNSNASIKPANTPHQFGDPHLRNRGRAACGGSSGAQIQYPIPTNFSLGSMGGYLTYAEFLQNIDDMATQYPNLITPRAAIGPSGSPYLTHEGREIYYLKISDNPGTDETNEPEVLYTSIHHAREPASLSQLIYYMWYLLENYGTDPEVTYLVDNVEMFFVPMINPDGYIINENDQPNGGGMWRKNARDNDNSGTINNQDGVDLNRNYSYQWGVSGASTNPQDQNYMGPSAFSEPETQAMKYFCENRNFEIAQNAHTYAALLLHPFGYATVQTADHDQFQAWTALMVKENGYGNILSSDLYPAAGDSDDWMYAGDLATKPKIFAMTPEIGEDAHGFWPATSEIQRICNDLVWQNLNMAHLALIAGTIEDQSPQAYVNNSGYIQYEVQRLGLDAGMLEVEVIPVGTGIATVGSPNQHTGLAMLQTETDSISYTLDAGLVPGQEFKYVLSVSNGSHAWTDTITKIYGASTITFADDGNTMNNWTSSTWGLDNGTYYSPSSSIADSPGSNYNNNTSNEIELNNTIDLSNLTSANLTFWAQWDIESGYDYCQLMVSTNSGASWTPVCGQYTSTGSSNQDPGEPVWDGTQSSWVKERIDLNDFLGQTIMLKFRFESDVWVNGDGFFFDDMELNTYPDPSAITEENNPVLLMDAMPNPASSRTWIQYEMKDGKSGELQVLNSLGQTVRTVSVSGAEKRINLNISDLAEGVYLIRIVSGNYASPVKRLSVVR